MSVDTELWNKIYENRELFRARFEAKFERTDGCWIWTTSKNPDGYGQLQIYNRPCVANRLSYVMYIGRIPDGMMVLHKCNNPSCVNPDHLEAGTGDDNMKYMISCGRSLRGDKSPSRRNPQSRPRGSAVWKARLTESQVIEIDTRLKLGESPIVLAREFGVNDATVSHIKARRSWRHILVKQ